MPIAPQSNYLADAYAGFTKQEIIYDGDKENFPAQDSLTLNLQSGPSTSPLNGFLGADLAGDWYVLAVDTRIHETGALRSFELIATIEAVQ